MQEHAEVSYCEKRPFSGFRCEFKELWYVHIDNNQQCSAKSFKNKANALKNLDLDA